jgi:lipopolysaccharide export system protein LptA
VSKGSSTRTQALAIAIAAAAMLALGPFGAAQADTGEGAGAALERRIITIDSSGGTQRGNLRYGPIHYEHPEPDGIVATVSTLTIRAPRALLRGPDQVLLSQAQGQRQADFEGGVVVTRGRLTATGDQLAYDEATGLGVLMGSASVVIAPATEDEDEVLITAASVTFDVDTDVSISEGEVLLVNGDQAAEAERLRFEEARNLGQLTSGDGRTLVTRSGDEGPLTIEALEIRVLTDLKALYATGTVVVVDGPITSRGEVVFYDDEEEVAEVIGAPAVAVDEAAGVRLETDRIRQDVRFRFVEAIDATVPTSYSAEQFALTGE